MNKFPVSLLRQLLGCVQDGLSIRVTAQKLGISKSSVSFLSQTALSHGGRAKVAELIQLPDTQLLETFYPPTTKAYQEPDWVEVHKKLARRNATLKLLYDAYKSQVVKRAYTYTSFCRRYSEWRQANGLGVPNGNVQVIPGERMEIDFAGDNLKWIDPNCEVQRARLFIAVLPYSNLTYAEAFPQREATKLDLRHRSRTRILRRNAAGPCHGQCKGTRQALELVRGRSAADGTFPVQLL